MSRHSLEPRIPPGLLMALMCAALAVFLAAACAPHRRNFRPSDAADGNGAAVGRVIILRNGERDMENCTLCFERNDCYKLDETGLVFMTLPAGTAEFDLITCRGPSVEYTHSVRGISINIENGRKTLFGELVFHWETGTTTGASLIINPKDLLFVRKVAATNERKDGSLWVKVKADSPAVLEAYQEQFGRHDTLPILYAGAQYDPGLLNGSNSSDRGQASDENY